MGKVSLLLVVFINCLIQGAGLLMIPGRGSIHTIFALIYIATGIVAWIMTAFFGVGLLFLIPNFFVSQIHTLVVASSHNAKVKDFVAEAGADKAELNQLRDEQAAGAADS